MFEREHHQRIAVVLEALDATRLDEAGCLFGGGTALALRYGEYRESVDIDFLVSDLTGYRSLRQALDSTVGIAALTRTGHALQQARPVRADQYGIRTALLVDGVAIKFEIVLEGRMALEAAGHPERICGLATISATDAIATKMLAHADRWRDRSVMGRDLIDLAMMPAEPAALARGAQKARAAYGDSVLANLFTAIDTLQAQPLRLDECMRALRMHGISRAQLWSRMKALRSRLQRASAAAPPAPAGTQRP